MNPSLKLSKASRLLFLYPALSLLPLRLAYRLASHVSPFDKSFEKKYMSQWKLGLERLMNAGAFPDNTELHLNRCVKKHLRMLSWEAVDSYLVPRLSPERMTHLSQVTGVEYLQEALKQEKGVIIVTAHFCRLNMTAYSLGHLGIKNGILSQSVDKDNPYLDWVDRIYLKRKLARYYGVTRGTGLTLKDNPRLIYRALERNEIMIILMDAFPDSVRNFYNIPFLNGNLKLPKGIARISQKTGSPMVFSVVRPEDKWKVRVEISPISGIGEQGLMEACRKLEQNVRELPCQWWQWPYMQVMWSASEKQS